MELALDVDIAGLVAAIFAHWARGIEELEPFRILGHDIETGGIALQALFCTLKRGALRDHMLVLRADLRRIDKALRMVVHFWSGIVFER